MNNSINKVTLRGYVGKNPEIKQLSNNLMAKVSLATSENFKIGPKEWRTDTLWHNLVFWGKWAHFAELNLKTGMMIKVQGKLNYQNFKDANGDFKTFTQIVVESAKHIT